MTPAYRAWIALLTATRAAVPLSAGPDRLVLAQESARLVWTTARSVRTAGHTGAAQHWMRVAETTVSLAVVLDRRAGASSTRLGTGPAPDGWLLDTPGLRLAVRDLLDRLAATPPRCPQGGRR